jgi:GxxExxY protein
MDQNFIKTLASNVYKILGTGHSEIVYHKAFEVELRNNNISYSTKAPISLTYKGVIIGYSEPDIIIHSNNGEHIIVELKATTYAPRASEKAQLYSYMRSTGYTKGILINFPQPSSKTKTHDIHFFTFGFPEPQIPENQMSNESIIITDAVIDDIIIDDMFNTPYNKSNAKQEIPTIILDNTQYLPQI